MKGTINFSSLEVKALAEALPKLYENQISDFNGERAALAAAKAKIMSLHNKLNRPNLRKPKKQ